MERALTFEVDGEQLLGILHPATAVAEPHRGLLLVVGGPQYRVGSHRQFLLLARHLAAAGIPVFRFDYRGMGDSSGPQRDFEQIDEDIRAAIDRFQAESPGLREVVIWGLCDAASAALFYAWQDPRVSGLVLLNPWVRTEEGLAKAYLKGYYLRRLLSRDFWTSLISGRVNPLNSIRSLAAMVRQVAGAGRASNASGSLGGNAGVDADSEEKAATGATETSGTTAATAAASATTKGRQGQRLPPGPLPKRMAAGWRRFNGPILLILSGDDLTAAEFRDVANQSPAWQGLLDAPRVTHRELPEANHTFSRRVWRDQVADWTRDWISSST
ncbi:hydrolase 1, exosortase A system-associated [Halochromatium salexigens]|uniref:Hydrolase 1, exosortase A system-associated n=1 Tax=Halochromatium salexigens TaxID=49447 RepID=A0AAJ0XGA2_HALSE|nr:hydrolase 1, exosortase A system-associated [Halochromatium salexigens]MBK5930570.1 hydrolase 1, exosortase A system-associated [Halochromatium salexigens]